MRKQCEPSSINQINGSKSSEIRLHSADTYHIALITLIRSETDGEFKRKNIQINMLKSRKK
uniref:Uncharacterized protein n=1 Tax=Anguilla anguilla TaxID=7936 RepID=A0A0E9TZF1_ANGAN